MAFTADDIAEIIACLQSIAGNTEGTTNRIELDGPDYCQLDRIAQNLERIHATLEDLANAAKIIAHK